MMRMGSIARIAVAAALGLAATTTAAGAGQAAVTPALAAVTLSGDAAKRALTDSEITAAAAEQLVEACIAYATAHGAGASVVVLSPAGYIVHALRTDGQSPNNIDSAYYKAKTALYLRQPTRTIFNRWGAPDQQLARATLDLYLVPGGFPIVVSDRLIGAIGVGGGAGGDDECAHEALTTVLGPQPPLPAATPALNQR
jgi:glc operon protein GlcG